MTLTFGTLGPWVLRMLLSSSMPVSDELEPRRLTNQTNDPCDVDVVVLEPRLLALPVGGKCRRIETMSPIVGAQSVSGVGDGGNGPSLSNCVERFDDIPSVLKHHGVRHRGSTINAHVAVDEESGATGSFCLVQSRNALIEPRITLCATIIVRTEVVVANRRGVLEEYVFVGPFLSEVDHVSDIR